MAYNSQTNATLNNQVSKNKLEVSGNNQKYTLLDFGIKGRTTANPFLKNSDNEALNNRLVKVQATKKKKTKEDKDISYINLRFDTSLKHNK